MDREDRVVGHHRNIPGGGAGQDGPDWMEEERDEEGQEGRGGEGDSL